MKTEIPEKYRKAADGGEFQKKIVFYQCHRRANPSNQLMLKVLVRLSQFISYGIHFFFTLHHGLYKLISYQKNIVYFLSK